MDIILGLMENIVMLNIKWVILLALRSKGLLNISLFVLLKECIFKYDI